MSTPYPPAPRKLERSRTNKVLGGVCGGVAKYVNMDPTLVRVLTVVISLFTGVPVVLYIIALFVIPEESASAGPQSYPPVNAPQESYGPTYPQSTPPYDFTAGQPTYAQPPSAPSAPTPEFGGTSPSDADEAVWGTEGAPWEQRSSTSGPATSAPDEPADWQPTPGGEPGAASTPAPETDEATPAPEETSTWESAPADPDAGKPADKQE